jgi:hypothetical protein
MAGMVLHCTLAQPKPCQHATTAVKYQQRCELDGDTEKRSGNGNGNCSGKKWRGQNHWTSFRALRTVKDFLILHGKRRFITVSITARYWFLS